MTTIEYAKRKTREELERRITDYKKRLDAWESVEIVTKKDGKPFANMAKNFKGAYYKKTGFSISSYSYELTVYGNYPNYVNDESINCYEIIRYMDKSDTRAIDKPQNIAPHEQYVEDGYIYDLEDIKNAIEQRKEYLRGYIKTLESYLLEYAEIVETFGARFNELKTDLLTATRASECKSLFYIIRETRLFEL